MPAHRLRQARSEAEARRLIGFAKHDPKAEAGKIRTLLTHEVRKLGLKGLKSPCRAHAGGNSRSGRRVGHPYPQCTRRRSRIVWRLSEPIRGSTSSWPTSAVSPPGTGETTYWRSDAGKRLPNLHMDISGVLFFRYLEQAAKELPAEKLLFGSDSPLVDARVELAQDPPFEASSGERGKGSGWKRTPSAQTVNPPSSDSLQGCVRRVGRVLRGPPCPAGGPRKTRPTLRTGRFRKLPQGILLGNCNQ